MKTWLQLQFEKKPALMTIWAGLAAFLAYFSMYLYRKPFTAGTFSSFQLAGMDYKTILVVAQVIGYAISKSIGIRIISQMKKEQRFFYFLMCLSISQFALFLFAVAPHPYGWIFLLISALPLGLIWGIVFHYLEGRKVSEIFTVIVSANFILTSGVAKSLGKWCMSLGIAETTMPAFIGICVLPVGFLTIWMLEQVPAPTKEDIISRKERVSMTRENRKTVLNQFGWMLALFSFMYIVLTAIRDIRDNFGVEIWKELGFGEAIQLYTFSEIPVTMVVLLCLGLLFLIKDNVQALTVQIGMILSSITLFLLVTFLYTEGVAGPATWMILSGIGLFVPYILFNGMIFERVIGAFRVDANVGFFMYHVDTAGYIFSVGILIWKTLESKSFSWLDFYIHLCFTGGLLILLAMIPLWMELKKQKKNLLLINT